MKGKSLLFVLGFFGSMILYMGCQKDPEIDMSNEIQFPPHTPTTYNLPPSKPGIPPYEIKADNPLTEEGVALGRFLFYDPILSGDSTQSCASCHLQEKAFTDTRRFSVGITGAIGKRNSMALFNLMWHPRFFWDGRSPTLRDQVVHPIEDPTEMNTTMEKVLEKLNKSEFYRLHFHRAFGKSKPTRELYAKAMEQFLFTLISFNSEYDKFHRAEPTDFSQAAFRGLAIFNKEPSEGGADCFHCHGNNHFADFTMSNNGLNETHIDKGFGNITGNAFDNGKFKVVSLRNIELTAPYMHDGRFATLEELVEFYNSGVHANSPNLDPKMDEIPQGLNLTADQKSDLVAFLKSLTDTSFINNPRFANPFK